MEEIKKWSSCSLHRKGKVYFILLAGSGDHRFNPSTIDDLTGALELVRRSPDSGALVTANEGRFFSNGLDVDWIGQNLVSGGLRQIQLKFESLLSSFMRLDLPTIAAISGHASAGGFMVALAHDYRFMKSGNAVMYMSELDHGMFMPRSLMSVIRSKLGPGQLRDAVLKARKFSAHDGFKLGFIDGVFDTSESTIEAAVAEGENLAGRNWKRDVYASLRAQAFPGVIEDLEAHAEPYIWPSKL